MRAQITVKKGKERPIRGGHPWVFSGAIAKEDKSLAAGTEVELIDHKGDFLALGYYNSHSQIRVRVCSYKGSETLDKKFLTKRIKESIARRAHIDRNHTNAIRLVAHESDFLPGLVVDQYGDTISFQIVTAGMDVRRADIIEILKEQLEPKILIERSDEKVRLKEGLELRKEVLFGEVPAEGVWVKENNMQFLVDPFEGHKTGFYVDQRDNRDIVASYAKGKRVLNCFSYTGGFSVSCALQGASEVISVDESLPALNIAEKNFEKNGIETPSEFIKADVFKLLREFKEKGEKFDLIILDPPKFASSASNVNKACRGYQDLNRIAWQLLEDNGILATFSCSGLISRELFLKVVYSSTVDAYVEGQIIKHLSQSEDHPTRLSFPESLYLKGLLCRKVKKV